MSDFDPVEIYIDLKQNVDTEGEKATKSIDSMANASNKSLEKMRSDINKQKALLQQLVEELKLVNTTMAKQPTTGNEKSIAENTQLIKRIDELNQKLIEQEKLLDNIKAKQTTTNTSLGATSISTQHVTQNMNSLNMSIQQIARELPNFAISSRIGIMAISNNLPILQDELRKARLMNDALKASGQATVPVWRQITASLFSWQTGLVALITLGMLFSDKIGDWTAKLFDFKDGAKLSSDEISKLTDTLAKNISADMGQIDALFTALRNAKKGTSDYSDAKNKIIDQYGKYLSGLDSEIISLHNIEGAYKAITQAITEQARAKTLTAILQDADSEKTKTILDQYKIIRDKLIEKNGEQLGETLFKQFRSELESGKGLSWEMKNIFGTLTENKGAAVEIGSTVDYNENGAEDALKKINKAQDNYNKKVKETNILLGDLAGSNHKAVKSLIDDAKNELNIAELMPTDTVKHIEERNRAIETAKKKIEQYNKLGIVDTKKAEADKRIKAAQDLSQKEIEIEVQKQKALVALMADGIEKRKEQAKLDYEERLAEIAKMEKEYLDKLNTKKGYKPSDANYITSLTTYTAQNPQDTQSAAYNNSLGELRMNADREWANTEDKINTDAATTKKKIYDEVAARFMSDIEKQKQAINDFYDQQIKKITEAGGTQADVDKLNAERTRELYKTMLEYVGTYEQKRKFIIEQGENRKKTATTDMDKAAITKDTDTALFELDKKYSGAYAKIFGKASEMTKSGLAEAIKITQGEIKKAIENGADTEKLSVLYKELREKQDEMDSRDNYPFSGIIKGFTQLKKSAEDYKKSLNATGAERTALEESSQTNEQKGLKNLADGAVESTGYLTQICDKLKEIAEITGDDSLGQWASELKDGANMLSSAAQGAKSGGWIGALVSAGTSLMSSIIDGEANAIADRNKQQLEAIEYQHKYNLLLIERNYLEEKYTSIFGTSAIAQAAAAYKSAKDALEQYNSSISQNAELETATRNYTTSFLNPLEGLESKASDLLGNVFGKKTISKIESGAAKVANILTLGIFGFGGSKSNIEAVSKDAIERGMNALQASTVKVSSRKWYKIGSEDKYKTLYDLAPQMWNNSINGEFDVDAAKAFLETNTSISAEQREQIQNAIDLKTAYDDAMKVVEEQLNSWLGSMADSMADSIWDSVVNGGADAWSEWQDIGAKAIADIGKQMIAELIMTSYMDSFSDKLKAAYGSGKSAEEIATEVASITADMVNGLPAVLDTATQATETFVSNMEAKGIDFSSSRTASSSGIATASQDSVDELNGRMTAVQGFVYDIREYNKQVVADEKETMLWQNAVSSFLETIAGNTSYLKDIKDGIDSINTRGVKIKT